VLVPPPPPPPVATSALPLLVVPHAHQRSNPLLVIIQKLFPHGSPFVRVDESVLFFSLHPSIRSHTLDEVKLFDRRSNGEQVILVSVGPPPGLLRGGFPFC